MNLYTLTGIALQGEKILSTRVWNIQIERQIILDNIDQYGSDYHEDLYGYLVVEKVEILDKHPHVWSEEWFKWNEYEEKYVPWYKPQIVLNIWNWSVM